MARNQPEPPSHALSPTATVSSISYDFNRISIPTGTADHGFLTFHMSDNTTRTLGGHPDGPGGALRFDAQFEVTNPHDVRASFEISVPPGMTADTYARSLVHAAENYNTHPLPYDALGEEGYNSTSSTSSLLAHVGGQTALTDLTRIAGDIGVSKHIETRDDMPRPGADLTAVGAVDLQTIRGREVATGLDHASIPPDRFERGPVAPVPARGMGDQERFQEGLEGQLLRIPSSLQQELAERAVDADRLLHYRPTTLAYERDGQPVETSGLSQHGRLLEVNQFSVVQDTGRGGRAVYSRTELERAAGDNVESLRSQLLAGNDVQFTFAKGDLTTTTVQDRSARTPDLAAPSLAR